MAKFIIDFIAEIKIIKHFLSLSLAHSFFIPLLTLINLLTSILINLFLFRVPPRVCSQLQGTESESQSPPHQQKNVSVSSQNSHKIQNQPPPPSQHMQQSMPPNGPHRMSPGQHHQMPPQGYVPQPMHNYQPAPHPYSHTPSPYGSPQQVSNYD